MVNTLLWSLSVSRHAPIKPEQTRVRTIGAVAAPILTTTTVRKYFSSHSIRPMAPVLTGRASMPETHHHHHLPLKKKCLTKKLIIGRSCRVGGMEYPSALHGPLRNQAKRVTGGDCDVPRVTRSAYSKGEHQLIWYREIVRFLFCQYNIRSLTYYSW